MITFDRQAGPLQNFNRSHVNDISILLLLLVSVLVFSQRKLRKYEITSNKESFCWCIVENVSVLV